jgi:hypothetical protein
VFKEWARIHPALALQPLRSFFLPLLDYPFVNPTHEAQDFLYGDATVDARVHEVMTM